MTAADDKVREYEKSAEFADRFDPMEALAKADEAIAALEAELAETKTELYGATEAVHEFCVCDNDDCNLASAEGCSGHWAITVTCADRWSYAELKQIRAETAEAEEEAFDEGVTVESLRLVLCVPTHVRQMEVDDFADDLPEDGEAPDELLTAIDAFNAATKGVILSWWPGKTRLPAPPAESTNEGGDDE